MTTLNSFVIARYYYLNYDLNYHCSEKNHQTRIEKHLICLSNIKLANFLSRVQVKYTILLVTAYNTLAIDCAK